MYYAKTMQTSATGACSLIAECSLSYAKTMQTSATGACSLIAECSLSYAKIYIIISPAKRFDIKAYARPCLTGRLAEQYGPFGGAIRHVSGCKTARSMGRNGPFWLSVLRVAHFARRHFFSPSTSGIITTSTRLPWLMSSLTKADMVCGVCASTVCLYAECRSTP